MQPSEHLESARIIVGKATTRGHKSALGQFLTPQTVSRFMASLFRPSRQEECRLLDPGAGLGALTAAFIERWASEGLPLSRLSVTAYEIDNRLRTRLEETASDFWKHQGIKFETLEGDFVEHATLASLGFGRKNLHFTHAILNPPYKKISSASKHRHLLRKAGIETVNLYSGFLALVIRLMEPNGQIAAIIPRSFCNGPYYKPFRNLLIDETAIHHIHLFDSRDSAFKDDAVLQENVILLLEKGGKQGQVTITTSTDDGFADLQSFNMPFAAILHAEDKERFIHIPTSPGQSEIELSPSIRYSLEDIGLEVSTGPIVDFRLKSHLRSDPGLESVPLLYPSHFVDQRLIWPRNDHKKPNAIMLNGETRRWLYPNGFYTVVRRFSSKEEARRIVAHTIDPHSFTNPFLGFENHLNVFHSRRKGLEEDLAWGLFEYLNSAAVDAHFRRFNGHTQVNATDLRTMRYPSREALKELGRSVRVSTASVPPAIDLNLLRSA